MKVAKMDRQSHEPRGSVVSFGSTTAPPVADDDGLVEEQGARTTRAREGGNWKTAQRLPTQGEAGGVKFLHLAR